VFVATEVDAFPDPNADGKAVPGDTITDTVTITNTGNQTPQESVDEVFSGQQRPASIE